MTCASKPYLGLKTHFQVAVISECDTPHCAVVDQGTLVARLKSSQSSTKRHPLFVYFSLIQMAGNKPRVRTVTAQ